MSSLTHKDLEKLDKPQLIELCLVLGDTSTPIMRSINGYKKALDDMTDMLLEKNITDTSKEEKTWDVAKVVMEKMPHYHASLKAMTDTLMPSIAEDASIVKKAREGSISNFIE